MSVAREKISCQQIRVSRKAIPMAWIRWRETSRGVRLASVQWRDTKGRVRSKALKTSDPRLVEMHKQAVEAREEGRALPSVTVNAEEALTRFLEHVRLTRAPDTVRYYEAKLGPVWRAWARAPMGTWNRPMLEAYIKEHAEWSPRQIQMVVRACRRFIGWSEEAGVACPDFVGSFRGPAVHRSEPETLAPAELDRLLLQGRGHRLEPAIALAALAGLRQSEFLHLQAGDVDWDASTLLVRGSKTHRDRRVPINDRLLEVLKRHRPITGPIVRVVNPKNHSNHLRSLRLLCRKAGAPEVSWHPLRHTFGTMLAARGVDLPTIQRLMGHASGSTTTIYLHTDPSRMAEAVARLG